MLVGCRTIRSLRQALPVLGSASLEAWQHQPSPALQCVAAALLRRLSTGGSADNGQPPGPRFAAALSTQTALSLACAKVVDAVRRQLGEGVQPDFLQLLVSNDVYHQYMTLAPAFVYEQFAGPDLAPPVLVGGAVEAVMALSPRPAITSGVSLLAASLPGVRLFPFHTATDAVPTFSPEQWAALLRKPVPGSSGVHSESSSAAAVPSLPPASGSGCGGGGVCGVVFCEPHFVQIESLLRRLHNLVPGLALVGGVVQPGSASSSSAAMTSVLPGHGSVFLDRECHPHGAVGCLMQGPIQLQTRVASACRPVGPVMQVTSAHGNTVVQLDGIPAVLALRQAMEEVGAASGTCVAQLPLEVGVDFSGRGLGFLPRGLGQANPTVGTVQLMGSEVPVGALVQLHLLDAKWGAVQFKRQLSRLLSPPVVAPMAKAAAGQLGKPGAEAAAGSTVATAVGCSLTIAPGGIQQPSAPWAPVAASQALFDFTCTTVANDDPWVVAEQQAAGAVAGGGLALAGGKVQGELGPAPGDSGTALHSFTSTLGLLKGA